MKLVILVVIAAALMLTTASASGAEKTVSLRDYNVSLDFGDKDVSIDPMHSGLNGDTVYHYVKFNGENETDYATVYLYEYSTPQTLDLQERLWKFMKPYCTMVDIDQGTVSGMGGFIGKGNARVERGFSKQVCYGGIAALPSGAATRMDFIIMAHFADKALNEQLVKTAKIEFAGKMVKI